MTELEKTIKTIHELVSKENYERDYQQGRADSCGTIGVTEDGEYIMYNGHLYKKVADRVKGAEE